MSEETGVTWLRVPMKHGGERVDLTRLTDGRVMCQLCFGYFTLEELHLLPDGKREDVCAECAAEEQHVIPDTNDDT